MNDRWRRILAAALLLTTASPVLAQDGAARQVSWFSQFLWTDSFVGLLIIWTLVAMSALSIGYTIRLALQHRRATILPDEVRRDVADLLAAKRYREAIDAVATDPSYLARVTSAALLQASHGYGAMERAVEEAGESETVRILRPVEYLNVVGNLAPMLGLFGTVYGMINAFQVLVEEGGSPDPAKLAAGISTALVTTFWGLVVAMPALAAYALIRNRVDALTSEAILVAESLIAPFRPGQQAQAESSAKRPRATPKPE